MNSALATRTAAFAGYAGRFAEQRTELAVPTATRRRMPGRTTTIIAAVSGFLWGGAAGVPGGASVRQGGPAGSISAMFFLQVFLLLCLLLFVPPFSRKAGWIMIAVLLAYALGLAAGHAAGYLGGNFVSWHPD
jgi:hypothetical protein